MTELLSRVNYPGKPTFLTVCDTILTPARIALGYEEITFEKVESASDEKKYQIIQAKKVYNAALRGIAGVLACTILLIPSLIALAVKYACFDQQEKALDPIRKAVERGIQTKPASKPPTPKKPDPEAKPVDKKPIAEERPKGAVPLRTSSPEGQPLPAADRPRPLQAQGAAPSERPRAAAHAASAQRQQNPSRSIPTAEEMMGRPFDQALEQIVREAAAQRSHAAAATSQSMAPVMKSPSDDRLHDAVIESFKLQAAFVAKDPIAAVLSWYNRQAQPNLIINQESGINHEEYRQILETDLNLLLENETAQKCLLMDFRSLQTGFRASLSDKEIMGIMRNAPRMMMLANTFPHDRFEHLRSPAASAARPESKDPMPAMTGQEAVLNWYKMLDSWIQSGERYADALINSFDDNYHAIKGYIVRDYKKIHRGYQGLDMHILDEVRRNPSCMKDWKKAYPDKSAALASSATTEQPAAAAHPERKRQPLKELSAAESIAIGWYKNPDSDRLDDLFVTPGVGDVLCRDYKALYPYGLTEPHLIINRLKESRNIMTNWKRAYEGYDLGS